MNIPIRNILISILLSVLLVLVGCGDKSDWIPTPYDEVDTLDGIWIEINEYSFKPTGLSIVFRNTTDSDDYRYGANFELEEYHRGNWFMKDKIAREIPIEFPLWSRHVYTEETLEELLSSVEDELSMGYMPNEMYYHWCDYYGFLEKGKYRLIVRILSPGFFVQGEAPPYEHFLTAEFSIE